MLQAAIISKPQKPEVAGILRDLIAWLEARHYNYLLDPDSAAYIDAPNPIERIDLPKYKPNLVIVLGGDGTLLAAARAFARTTTPILSVNLGALGFLTEIPLSDLYLTLEDWCQNRADIEVRSMMHAEIIRGGKTVQEWDALNDVVVAKGTIVSTRGRSQPSETLVATGGAIPGSIPVAVLVDGNTASAAEIVTAALQDHHRATVVGTHTFGKGVFQEQEPLSNGGALEITVGEYFTPDGRNLGGGGVKLGAGIAPEVRVASGVDSLHGLAVALRTLAAKVK